MVAVVDIASGQNISHTIDAPTSGADPNLTFNIPLRGGK